MPERTVPRAGEIDLWRVNLEQDPASIDSLFELLPSDEKDRANKFVFAKDRLHFIAARGELRKIIGGYLGMSPEEVKFSVRHYGKPYLSSDDEGLKFNLSHSRGIALIAVSGGREVGVDVECVNTDFDVFSIAPSVFSAAEVERIRSLSSDVQAETFFAGWTRKEALLKAMGDGLSSPEELQTAISSIGADEVVFRSSENGKYTDWSLTSFELDGGFKAALAVEGNVRNIRYCRQTPLASHRERPGTSNLTGASAVTEPLAIQA